MKYSCCGGLFCNADCFYFDYGSSIYCAGENFVSFKYFKRYGFACKRGIIDESFSLCDDAVHRNTLSRFYDNRFACLNVACVNGYRFSVTNDVRCVRAYVHKRLN